MTNQQKTADEIENEERDMDALLAEATTRYLHAEAARITQRLEKERDKKLKQAGLSEKARNQLARIDNLVDEYVQAGRDLTTPAFFAEARKSPQAEEKAIQTFLQTNRAAFQTFMTRSMSGLGMRVNASEMWTKEYEDDTKAEFYKGLAFDNRMLIGEAGFTLALTNMDVAREMRETLSQSKMRADKSSAFLAEAEQRFPEYMARVKQRHLNPGTPNAQGNTPEEEKEFRAWAAPRLIAIGIVSADKFKEREAERRKWEKDREEFKEYMDDLHKRSGAGQTQTVVETAAGTADVVHEPLDPARLSENARAMTLKGEQADNNAMRATLPKLFNPLPNKEQGI